MDNTYDYVIVGAGSAGCTLGNRLSEDRDVKILVLEAGGWDRDPWISIPLGWGKILEHRLHDWMYFAEPAPSLDNRRVECARGKVVGGSSSINAMAYVRGHRGDYERWATGYGLTQWSYAQALPYFRRQESWEEGPSSYRGGDGPLTTRFSRFTDPLSAAYFAAGAELGFPQTQDYNGAQQEGFGILQSTIRNGRRCSAAVAYLKPALARTNLTLAVNALATRINIENQRAVGIDYLANGRPLSVRAAREVILAGGVVNSPQLLMLSGIGDAAELKALGIQVVLDLPGVGKNLQDHLSVGVDYARKERGPFAKAMRLDRIGLSLAQAYFLGTGFATDLPSGWTAFLKSSEAGAMPDIQLLFRAGPGAAGPYLPPFMPGFADGFACRAVLLRPESRGTVKLASADPRALARIEQNFLASEKDRKTIRAGVRLVREIGQQAPLRPFVEAELLPGAGHNSDAELDAHIRATAATAHHPLGTCKMGFDSDPLAVVDPELRLRGIAGLRVVDASVMPDLVGGNINAAVIMIAEKAADLIRGRPTPAPVNI